MDLNQVTLPVSDMQEAISFYIAMGFTLIVDTPHYARFSCPQGNSTFSLSLEDMPIPQGAVIYFETEKRERVDLYCTIFVLYISALIAVQSYRPSGAKSKDCGKE